MPDFEIRITTPAEMEGALAAEASLERQIGQCKALGKSYQDLEAQLARVRKVIADSKNAGPQGVDKDIQDILKGEGVGGIEKVTEATKEAGRHMGIFGKMTHEVRAGLHLLGEEVPGLGRLGHFLFTPMTAIIGVGILAITSMKESLESLKSTMEEMEASPGARGEWADKQREAMIEASVEAAKFNQSIWAIATAEQTLKEKTEEALAHDKLRLQGIGEISTAAKELAEAQVKARKDAGEITEAQAIKLKVEIDEKYFQDQLEMKVKLLEAEFKARQKQVAGAQDEVNAAGKKKDEADAAAKASGDAKIKNDGMLDQAKKNIEMATAAREANDKALAKDKEKHSGIGAMLKDTYLENPADIAITRNLKLNDKIIQEELERARKMKAQAEANQKAIDEADGTAKAAVDSAAKKVTQVANDAHEAQGKLKNVGEDIAITKDTNAVLAEEKSKALRTAGEATKTEKRKALEKREKSKEGLTGDEVAELAGLRSEPSLLTAPPVIRPKGPVPYAGQNDPMHFELADLAKKLAYETQRQHEGKGKNDAGAIVDVLKHILALQKSSAHKDTKQDQELAELKREFMNLKGAQGTAANP